MKLNSKYREHFKRTEGGYQPCGSTDHGVDLTGLRYQFERVSPNQLRCVGCANNPVKFDSRNNPLCFLCLKLGGLN